MKVLIFLAGALIAACGLDAGAAAAQTRKPTAEDVAAIHNCAQKYKDDVSAGEDKCLFRLVADPCGKTREGRSDHGRADCFRLEQDIWGDLLNANFNRLRAELDDDQKAKLRDMQRAWIAYRDTTCAFYYDKIQGTMAQPMTAACLARETARRALLLDFFARL